jgi:hypothetical protein
MVGGSFGAAFTVKVCAAVVPPVVVTARPRAPVAAAASIATVAVINVALTTLTLLTVTPLPVTAIVAPATKFVPVTATVSDVPAVPLVGAMLLSVGVATDGDVGVDGVFVPVHAVVSAARQTTARS